MTAPAYATDGVHLDAGDSFSGFADAGLAPGQVVIALHTGGLRAVSCWNFLANLDGWDDLKGDVPQPRVKIHGISHGGHGALVVVDEGDVGYLFQCAPWWGIQAIRVGIITKSENSALTIKSKFDGTTLMWK